MRLAGLNRCGDRSREIPTAVIAKIATPIHVRARRVMTGSATRPEQAYGRPHRFGDVGPGTKQTRSFLTRRAAPDGTVLTAGRQAASIIAWTGVGGPGLLARR